MAFNNSPYYQPAWNTPRYPGMMEQAVPQIKGRPVSSIDEVRATTIDFDGSVFYFPDLANKKIYTKQINYDGTSTLNVYELKPIPVEPVVNSSQFVTREEFETVLQRIEQKFAAGPVQSIPQSAPAPQKPVETPAPQPKPQALNF